jgi:hypothetical protein
VHRQQEALVDCRCVAFRMQPNVSRRPEHARSLVSERTS